MSAFARQPCDEGVVLGAPDVSPCPSRTETWILAATILGSSMAFIDGSVVNVALPALQADFHASVADVQWVIEAYSLFLSCLILVGGSLGDKYGRRRIYAVGVFLFTATSVVCGLAQSINMLIVARAVQGIGGALLVPGSLAIISASFSEEQRGRAIGTWSGFSAMTSAAGPLVGGFLIQSISWRAIFFINVPLAAAVLAILFRHVPESRNEEAARLDWLGAFLCTAGLGGIVFGLIESSTLGLGDPLVVASIVVGIVVLIGFVFAESRVQTPMMPLSLFRSRMFSGANLLTLLLYGALGGALFFLPFNLIRVQGYSTTAAGAAFLPFILIMFLGSRWAGGLVSRVGAKLPLIVGPTITAVGLGLIAVPGIGGGYVATFFPGILVMGVGMTIAVAPLTTVVMSAVDQRHAGIASGINNAASRAAGLVAIAALSLVAVQAFSSKLDSKLLSLRSPPRLHDQIYGQRTSLINIQIPAGVSGPVRAALQRAIAESFVGAFRLVVLIAAGLALLSALTAALTIEGKRPAEAALRVPVPPEEEPAASA